MGSNTKIILTLSSIIALVGLIFYMIRDKNKSDIELEGNATWHYSYEKDYGIVHGTKDVHADSVIHNGCTYIRFVHTNVSGSDKNNFSYGNWGAHSGTCPNPIHK